MPRGFDSSFPPTRHTHSLSHTNKDSTPSPPELPSAPYPGIEVLRACEARYKQEVGRVQRGLSAFFDEHVTKQDRPDKVLGALYSDYNTTVFTHSILGGAFGYILARAVTTRLAPSPRLFATTTFTALSAFMGAYSATSLATAELVKKSLP